MRIVIPFIIFLFATNAHAQSMKADAPLIIYKGKSNGYSNVVVIDHESYKMVYISGQVSINPDLESQIRDVFGKIQDILKAEGGSFKDLIKMNHYFVGYQPEHLVVFRKIRGEYFGDSIAPASTLVGVEALGQPEWLVEIEAIALIKTQKVGN